MLHAACMRCLHAAADACSAVAAWERERAAVRILARVGTPYAAAECEPCQAERPVVLPCRTGSLRDTGSTNDLETLGTNPNSGRNTHSRTSSVGDLDPLGEALPQLAGVLCHACCCP